MIGVILARIATEKDAPSGALAGASGSGSYGARFARRLKVLEVVGMDKKEYIERGAFLRKCAEAWGHYGVTIKAIEGIADECAAADVVEVVRCKDCIHSVQLLDRLMCNRNAHKSENGWFGLRATAEDHFCSYGERKE